MLFLFCAPLVPWGPNSGNQIKMFSQLPNPSKNLFPMFLLMFSKFGFRTEAPAPRPRKHTFVDDMFMICQILLIIAKSLSLCSHGFRIWFCSEARSAETSQAYLFSQSSHYRLIVFSSFSHDLFIIFLSSSLHLVAVFSSSFHLLLIIFSSTVDHAFVFSTQV